MIVSKKYFICSANVKKEVMQSVLPLTVLDIYESSKLWKAGMYRQGEVRHHTVHSGRPLTIALEIWTVFASHIDNIEK